MKNKVKIFPLTVGITSFSILASTLLVIVGTFDSWLEWDIFSSQLEKVLIAIFGSTIALAGFGFCLTIVLGTLEIVRSFNRRYEGNDPNGQGHIGKSGKLLYFRYIVMIMLFVALVIGGLHYTNYTITLKRNVVFKETVQQQIVELADRFSELFNNVAITQSSHVPVSYYELLTTLENQSFIRQATMYFPDQADKQAMWGYKPWGNKYSKEDGFSRFFITRDFEKAMEKAIAGDAADLDRLNQEAEFTWYHQVKNQGEETIAILRIDGNEKESFRGY